MILTPKWFDILMKCDNKNVLQVSRETNTIYNHTLKVVGILKDLELINVEKIGRQNHITLTKKGLRVQQSISKMRKELK